MLTTILDHNDIRLQPIKRLTRKAKTSGQKGHLYPRSERSGRPDRSDVWADHRPMAEALVPTDVREAFFGDLFRPAG